MTVCSRSHSRSRSPKQVTGCFAGNHEEHIVAAATVRLRALCAEHRIPDSHGALHAERVLGHVEQALAEASDRVGRDRALAVRLAALLHDADDRKYFPGCNGGTCPNASRLMKEAGASTEVVSDALRMIALVSCSKNGNSAPPEALSEPELLWPRWADRVEAVGKVGVVRCWQYNEETGGKLCLPSTPRPRSEAEVWALATPHRFEAYQLSGGKSASMIDHYYDKLLRVAQPPVELLGSRYFEVEMAKGAAPLVEVCLAYSESGEAPLGLLRSMAEQLLEN